MDHYPAAFDHAQDDQIDSLAGSIAKQISDKSDVNRTEYGAVIWRDANGNLHSTTIVKGDANHTPISNVWNEIDFEHGGQVVAIIHSHPSEYNADSKDYPNWQPQPSGNTLSSGDFDNLMDYGSKTHSGIDTNNYRSYLVFQGEVKEYYAFDHDSANVSRGGQATWAIPSYDYGN